MSVQPWHIAVLIPARNEEDLLPRCLQSVLKSFSSLPPSTSYDLVIAVDRSTDRTFPLAQDFIAQGLGLLASGVVICTDAGVVGRARAAAADKALSRYRGPLNRCWLANTDADCLVPADWLHRQLEFASAQVEAIAGIVDVDTFVDHQPIVAERFRSTYVVRADGSHPHVHGANLGVRADSYLQAGGWHNLATAEDHDLWNRLGVAGARRVSTSRLAVLTSGRRVGRAPHGFADALAAHNETAA